MYKPTLKNSKN